MTCIYLPFLFLLLCGTGLTDHDVNSATIDELICQRMGQLKHLSSIKDTLQSITGGAGGGGAAEKAEKG